MPRAARGPARPARLRARPPARARRHRPARGDARRSRRCSSRPAPPRTRRRSGSTRSTRDPDGFRWRTQAQIGEGRSWLWVENGTILFKAEASAWTPEAVQLQQVWVDPSVRNRGNAQRGDARPLPPPARAGAPGLPVRAARERAGDPRLRGDRDAADDHVPEPDLLRLARRSRGTPFPAGPSLRAGVRGYSRDGGVCKAARVMVRRLLRLVVLAWLCAGRRSRRRRTGRGSAPAALLPAV